mgnify:CR=1 FL=1
MEADTQGDIDQAELKQKLYKQLKNTGVVNAVKVRVLIELSC